RGNFPFYYAQIAPYKYDGKNSSAYLREAQLEASGNIPNVGMVVTMDVGSKHTIHPPDKTTVAARMVNLALAKTYHRKSIQEVDSPILSQSKVKGNSVHLYFNH